MDLVEQAREPLNLVDDNPFTIRDCCEHASEQPRIGEQISEQRFI